ncbi:MAG: C4-dicarboxylate TRAP transporter substrate-binding protein [Rhodospirillales bacterium]|nr:C4-dicarboxylate TRAP transporter substrate-binding protein [Rhodospirillales bacterium]
MERNITTLFAARVGRAGLLAGLAVALGVSFGGAQTAKAETYTFRAGAGHPAVLAYVAKFKSYFIPEFTKRVKAATGDTVKVTQHYGGSVAKLPEVFDAVESGLLDFGLLSVPFEPRNLFLANFGYKVPFGPEDPVRAGEIARQIYNAVPEMNTSLESKNNVVLAVLTASNYQIATKKPWKTLADLKGRKIQAAGPNLSWLNGTGAVPVQGGLAGAYNNLQTGVSEGILMHYQGIKSFKLYEPAPYIASIDFGALPINMLTINKKKYNALPEKVRKIMHEVAAIYEPQVNKANAEADKTAIEEMKKKGAKILKISDDVKKQWANHLTKVPNDAADEGDKLGLPMRKVLKLYIDILKKDGNEKMDAYKL